MYNMATPVTVTGIVKRFEWTNPHAFVFLEVKDEKGNMVEWEVEMMSLNHLQGVRLDPKHRETRRHDLVHRRRGKERGSVDDQLVHEAGRRPNDEVLRRSWQMRAVLSRRRDLCVVASVAVVGAGARARARCRRPGCAEDGAGSRSRRI